MSAINSALGEALNTVDRNSCLVRTAPNLNGLLAPRAIAIVGASEDPKRTGGQPVNALKNYGFQGAIYPVNPKYERIQDIQCYPNLASVPQPCDVALIILPADQVPQSIEQCGRAGIPFAIILSAGFIETGNSQLQERLKAAISSSGVRVIGPNCVGILNIKDRIFAGFGAGFRNPNLKAGPVAMVSQSGGFGYSVVAFAAHAGIGFKYMISTGNEVDLTSLDVIADLLERPDIELIVSYMEAVKDGKRLREIGARALELRKPIVVWKVGNTERGAKAALSHTASLTGNFELYRAAFREGGFVEIADLYDLVDVALAFRHRRLPAGNRIGVVTTSGGLGVLLADRCVQRGLALAEPNAETCIALRNLEPGFSTVTNPVDLSAKFAADADGFNEATRILLEDPGVDMAIVRSLSGGVAAWADGLGKIADATGKLVLVNLSGLAHQLEHVAFALDLKGIPCFESPGRTVTAAAALTEFSAKVNRHKQRESRVVKPCALDLGDTAVTLSEKKSKACLTAYGIPVVNEIAIAKEDIDALSSLPFEFPVVVKIDSPDVPHKTEIRAVRIDVRSVSEVKTCAHEIIAATKNCKPTAHIDGVLVQDMIQGIEMIVGGVNDPSFGPYIVLGMGGVLAEIICDTTIRYAPFGVNTARAMIAELKATRILQGYRGDKPYDIDALAEAIARLSWLMVDHSDRIAELDINPLFVGHAGSGVVAADCLIICKA